MGVTGGTSDRRLILLAGVAGLLAGAFSMGAGEYISVTSQRELFEGELALEAEEIEAMPEEEANELALIYRAKGVSREEAEAMAARIMRDRTTALDTMAREELGLNPDELGSPWGVAASSFVSFAAGAAVPVLPWLVASGVAAFAASVALSVLALFLVGAGISLLTGRSLIQSGARQLLVGGLAAAATFGIGRLIGVSVELTETPMTNGELRRVLLLGPPVPARGPWPRTCPSCSACPTCRRGSCCGPRPPRVTPIASPSRSSAATPSPTGSPSR